MKALFFTLLALNVLLGLWLWTNGPADTLREPGRIERQVLPEQFKILDDAQMKAIDAEIRKIVGDAAEFAQQSPEPDPSELWTDVLVGA